MSDDATTNQFVINPDAPAESLEAKRPWVDNGVDIVAPDRYYSNDFMSEEWNKLWPKVWLIAGVESDLPDLNDYFVFDVGHESIIVSHTKEGIQAHYNVCSHRGNRLVQQERGNNKQFTCPFHSWRFSNQGELRFITDRHTFREELVCDNPGLTPVNCVVHAGIIFINMSDNPPDIKDYLGLPEGYLEAYQVEKMKVVRHQRVEWDANWKTGIDAFYETYHLHAVHPETAGVMGDLNVQFDTFENGASRMIVPIGVPTIRARDQDAMNEGLDWMLSTVGIDPAGFEGGAQEVRAAIQKAKRKNAEEQGVDYSQLTDGQLTDSWATGVFPNVQMGMHAEAVFLMRFLPHATDPEKFYYDTMTLMHPISDPSHQAPAWMGLPEDTDLSGNTRENMVEIQSDDNEALGVVLAQDSELIPVVQQGIRSRGFKGPIWGEQEQRLRHFHAELDRYLNDEK